MLRAFKGKDRTELNFKETKEAKHATLVCPIVVRRFTTIIKKKTCVYFLLIINK